MRASRCGACPPSHCDVLLLQTRWSVTASDSSWTRRRRKSCGVHISNHSINCQQVHYQSKTIWWRQSVPSAVHLDVDLIMRNRVAKTAASCFAALRQIRSIRRSVSPAVLRSLVVSLVLSRLDYGCSTLAGLPNQLHVVGRLQSVLNAAARLIFGVTTESHAPQSSLVAAAWKNHLSASCDCVPLPPRLGTCIPHFVALPGVTRQRSSSLRSSSTTDLVIPRSINAMIGGRAFAASVTSAWNSISDSTRSAPSLNTSHSSQDRTVSEVF